MYVLYNIGIVILTFVFMECVTWLTHKYIMHGLFWNLHEDHHNKTPHFFEKNDYFFVMFALISMFFFGVGNFVEGYRFKWFTRTDNIYFRALRKAHKVHHKHLGKQEGECFGMLFVPLRYFKEAMRSKQ
jgi:beta-carotene 3-hydroxylase